MHDQKDNRATASVAYGLQMDRRTRKNHVDCKPCWHDIFLTAGTDDGLSILSILQSTCSPFELLTVT